MSDIDLAVARLRQARAGQSAPSAPELPDAAAAYAAQEQVARELGWFGDSTPRYWKSGGPSREALALHAALPPAGVWSSPADASAWPLTLRGIEIVTLQPYTVEDIFGDVRRIAAALRVPERGEGVVRQARGSPDFKARVSHSGHQIELCAHCAGAPVSGVGMETIRSGR